MRLNGYQPIENYGVIGDMNTVALVGIDGSIDFMCFPNFDSPTIFAALLDPENGGRFAIHPCFDEVSEKQMYLPDTNILLTRFLSSVGVGEVSDFMAFSKNPDSARTLVRRVKCVRGTVEFTMLCSPRFDYGRAGHRIATTDTGALFTSDRADGLAVHLHSTAPLDIHDGVARSRFRLSAGETASFVIECAAAGTPPIATNPDYVSESFKKTQNFWREWVSRSNYTGRWREMVTRSALTLKLLVSQKYGSLVAAPTFGLPEMVGGRRNWDYRYTWIRDASFTLYALMRLGYMAEAGAFMGWIEDRASDLNDDGSLQIMYGIDGRKYLPETTLGHFAGYRRSSPVRIGNGAHDQLQLDIYGELMDSIYIYNKYGEPISHDLWRNCVRLVDYVAANWRTPDEGIWEVRGGRQEFLYSRFMSWVAIDRGLRLAGKRSFPAPVHRWMKTRDAIYRDIHKNFWDPVRKSFVQHKGTTTLDGATLLMPMVKFISPTDPRWLSTLKAIEDELVEDSLVYRYRTDDTDDGLVGDEGTFNMVSFWYAETLARSGDVRQARYVFEKMLTFGNHLGLYSEELGPHGEHLGNYPQAFTHLGLISAAYAIDRKLSDSHWVG